MEYGAIYFTRNCPVCGKLAVSEADSNIANCPCGQYSYVEDRGRTSERIGAIWFHYYDKDPRVAAMIERMAKAYGHRK